MASISSTEYRIFFDQPVTVTATAANYSGATFHRLRLKVKINNAYEFEFSSPVSSDALTVKFDISSAFRAVADSHQYSATVLNVYPALTAEVTACSDYMIDGQEHTGAGESPATTIGPLYAGRLTDMERLTGTVPACYSRKPKSSPEIAFEGYAFLSADNLSSDLAPSPPHVSVMSVDEQTMSSCNIYAIPAPPDSYELRFINSLGVHENVFLTGLPKREVSISTDQYVMARKETLSQFSRGLAVKQNDYETWTLSSGPLDRQWQSWYVHEVLMARWAWLNVGGNYIPCHILPEESLTLYDRQKPEAMTVPIVVRLDINGSPL